LGDEASNAENRNRPILANRFTLFYLYFGGNGENASTRILRLCRNEETRAIFEGYDFAFIDYPKYGQSEGEIRFSRSTMIVPGYSQTPFPSIARR
jgi:hypothetical protein